MENKILLAVSVVIVALAAFGCGYCLGRIDEILKSIRHRIGPW